MSNAPKKIYYDDFAGTVNREWMVGDTTYIRADLVDELVKALKEVVRYAGNNGDDYLADKARAALKRLEESHD